MKLKMTTLARTSFQRKVNSVAVGDTVNNFRVQVYDAGALESGRLRKSTGRNFQRFSSVSYNLPINYIHRKTDVSPSIENRDLENATLSDDELEQEIALYEKQYGFSSEKLLEMAAEGKLPDTFDMQKWFILLKYRL